MELNDFVNKFAEQFDDTDSEEIKADTQFKNLDEWGSLVALAVIAFVKTEYGKTVTGKEIRECNTVKDLFNLVASK